MYLISVFILGIFEQNIHVMLCQNPLRIPKLSPQPTAERTMPSEYTKAFTPLESDPTIFTALAHDLGLAANVSFVDILSIDDPDLLALVPRPVYALILIFPTSDKYESQKDIEEREVQPYEGSGENEVVVWWRQAIKNACGLYGLLHAVCNGAARTHISTYDPNLRKKPCND
jgi:Ubiquitin carboxyl-terminal hydrolase, family 1